MPDFSLERKPAESGSKPSKGPATKYFAAVLKDLLNHHAARDPETGRTRKAKATSLSESLKSQNAEEALRGVSTSALYRLVNEETSPRIDVIYELAKVFQVSPRVFLPEDVDH